MKKYSYLASEIASLHPICVVTPTGLSEDRIAIETRLPASNSLNKNIPLHVEMLYDNFLLYVLFRKNLGTRHNYLNRLHTVIHHGKRLRYAAFPPIVVYSHALFAENICSV
jgi:hypothetical protein